MNSASHTMHCMVYMGSPRHSPRGAQVLAASSTAWCTSARRTVHHTLNQCSPRNSQSSALVLASSLNIGTPGGLY